VKITTAQLRQIIKEEIESAMLESHSSYDKYVNRIGSLSMDFAPIKREIEHDETLTPEQKRDLLAQVEARKKKTSTDSVIYTGF